MNWIPDIETREAALRLDGLLAGVAFHLPTSKGEQNLTDTIRRRSDEAWINESAREARGRQLYATVANGLASICVPGPLATPVIAILLLYSATPLGGMELIVANNEADWPDELEAYLREIWAVMIQVALGQTDQKQGGVEMTKIILRHCWPKFCGRFGLKGPKPGKRDVRVLPEKSRAASAIAVFAALKNHPVFKDPKERNALSILHKLWEDLYVALTSRGLTKDETATFDADPKNADYFGKLGNIFREFRDGMNTTGVKLDTDTTAAVVTPLLIRCETIAKSLQPEFKTYEFDRHVTKVLSYFNIARALSLWAASNAFKTLIASHGHSLLVIKYIGTPPRAYKPNSLRFKQALSTEITDISRKPNKSAYTQPVRDFFEKLGNELVSRWTKYNKTDEEGWVIFNKAEVVHAELGTIEYVMVNDAAARIVQPYIGVSKLCCFLCKTFIDVFNEAKIFEFKFATRGSHGAAFVPWCMPNIKGSSKAKDLVKAFEECVWNRLVEIAHLLLEALAPKKHKRQRSSSTDQSDNVHSE